MLTDPYYRAIRVHKKSHQKFVIQLEELPFEQIALNPKLNDHVLVKVFFSSINYKDLMSCQGNPSVTRHFPHTPGIDAAGVVLESINASFSAGDKVIVICKPMGMNHNGGFADYVRVPASWLEAVPECMSLHDCMAIGSAGFTAALAVERIHKLIKLSSEVKVAVTGATGGVGSLAIGMLKRLGCHVTAISQHAEPQAFFELIGVDHQLSLQKFSQLPSHNLLNPLFNAVIDVAGGQTLATLLKLLEPNGIAVATGMVGDTALPANLLPFILRGVSLLGINAENTIKSDRHSLWNRIASDFMPLNLSNYYQTVLLQDLPKVLNQRLDAAFYDSKDIVTCGRTLVKMNE